MTDLRALALGRRIAESRQAHSGGLPALVLAADLGETYRSALKAVEREQAYFSAAHAIGIPESTARSVLEAELDRAQQLNGTLEDAFERARHRIFSGDWKASND